MNKIIGFLITPQKSKPEIDFFNVGLKIEEIKYQNFFIYLWGFGNINQCKIKDNYTLSFPIHESLLDKNILIRVEKKKIIIENDWLGSIPVFYNAKEKIISTIPNFCLKDKTIHKEGLTNFFEFGFSVFEQTPFRDVQFMRYYSQIVLKDNLEVNYKKDPVLGKDFLAHPSKEEDVIEQMKDYIEEQEKKIKGKILLPLSGGYDSRLLAYLVKDKSRIKSFTYGISKNPFKSEEVVRAKKISEIYNMDWEQVETSKFFEQKYIEEWFKIYGFSTHVHGMIEINFYEKILSLHSNNFSLLSGIFFDIWAGNIKYPEVKTYHEIIKISYNHGLSLNKNYLKIKSDYKHKKSFFQSAKHLLKDNKLKAVFTIRMKMILISYLITLPEYFKIPVWTPFLNFNLIKLTINIPEERRNNRIWKKDFFKKVGLNLEDMDLKSSKFNIQDFEAAKKTIFESIDVKLMKKFVQEKRLIEINKILQSKVSFFTSLIEYLSQVRGFGRMIRILKIKNKFLEALYDYLSIKAIEKALKG